MSSDAPISQKKLLFQYHLFGRTSGALQQDHWLTEDSCFFPLILVEIFELVRFTNRLKTQVHFFIYISTLHIQYSNIVFLSSWKYGKESYDCLVGASLGYYQYNILSSLFVACVSNTCLLLHSFKKFITSSMLTFEKKICSVI